MRPRRLAGRSSGAKRPSGAEPPASALGAARQSIILHLPRHCHCPEHASHHCHPAAERGRRALRRVAGLFSTRGYNIESLSVAPTDDPTVSRLTLVTTGSEAVIQQIANQLNKLVDVVSVEDMTHGRASRARARAAEAARPAGGYRCGSRLRRAHRWPRARSCAGRLHRRADGERGGDQHLRRRPRPRSRSCSKSCAAARWASAATPARCASCADSARKDRRVTEQTSRSRGEALPPPRARSSSSMIFPRSGWPTAAILEGLDAEIVDGRLRRGGAEARAGGQSSPSSCSMSTCPDIDGLETAELLRQHRNARHTPIIFVTAYADELQTARGYELGVVDYIQVPVIAPCHARQGGGVPGSVPDARGARARQPGAGVPRRRAHRRAAEQQRAAAGRDRRAPARRERARGAACARAIAARAGRGAQPAEGRVPGHHVARAAHAPECDLRVDHAAAHPAPG